MSILSQVINKVNEVFDEKHLDNLGRSTGFMKRKRKIGPKQFLENMLCLRLESPTSSLEELSLEFKKRNCDISRSALHKKITKAGANFYKAVLDSLFKITLGASDQCMAAISIIKSVKIVDSSEVRLNKKLRNVHPQIRGQGAAVKLQSLIDVMNNQLMLLEMQDSNKPDQSFRSHLNHVQENDLLIGDLGYFCIDSFRQTQAKKAFFLSRFFKTQKSMIFLQKLK